MIRTALHFASARHGRIASLVATHRPNRATTNPPEQWRDS